MISDRQRIREKRWTIAFLVFAVLLLLFSINTIFEANHVLDSEELQMGKWLQPDAGFGDSFNNYAVDIVSAFGADTYQELHDNLAALKTVLIVLMVITALVLLLWLVAFIKNLVSLWQYEIWGELKKQLKVFTANKDNEGLESLSEGVTGGTIRRVDLGEVDINEANPYELIMRGNYIAGIKLEGADLQGADLSGATLKGANLKKVNFGGANLDDANLEGADLQCANLRNANLLRANLSGANFKGADLRGADLGGANLKESILEGADLRGIKGYE